MAGRGGCDKDDDSDVGSNAAAETEAAAVEFSVVGSLDSGGEAPNITESKSPIFVETSPERRWREKKFR